MYIGTMEIDLTKCESKIMRFGKVDGENLNTDLYIFTHPNYFLYHGDPVIGYLYKEYEYAFVTFEIINN
jgi:hypothetical protein